MTYEKDNNVFLKMDNFHDRGVSKKNHGSGEGLSLEVGSKSGQYNWNNHAPPALAVRYLSAIRADMKYLRWKPDLRENGIKKKNGRILKPDATEKRRNFERMEEFLGCTYSIIRFR